MPYESPPVGDIVFEVDGAYTAPSTNSLDFDFTDESVAEATATTTTATSGLTQPTSTATATPVSTTPSTTSTPTPPAATTQSVVSASPTDAVSAQTSAQSVATSTAAGSPTTATASLSTASAGVLEQATAVQAGATTATTQPVTGATTTALSPEIEATTSPATPGVTTDTTAAAESTQASAVLQAPVFSIVEGAVAGGVSVTTTSPVATGSAQTSSPATSIATTTAPLDPATQLGATVTPSVVAETATLSEPTASTTVVPSASRTPATTSSQPAGAIVGVDAGATVSTQSVQTPTAAGTGFSTPSAQTTVADAEPTPPSVVLPGSITAPQKFLVSAGNGYETRLVDGDGTETGLDRFEDLGIAVDGAFNFYVSYKTTSYRKLVSFTTDGTKRWETSVPPLVSKFYRIAVSESGDLWAYDPDGYDSLYRYDKDTGAELESEVAKTDGITASAVDAAGALYLTFETGLIKKIVPNGGVEYSVSASDPAIDGGEICIDASGDYFFVQTAGGTVEKRSTSDGSLIASRQWDITTIDAVDADNNIYGSGTKTFGKFDFESDSVVWETSTLNGTAIEDAHSIDYRPDIGPVAIVRFDDDGSIARVITISDGTLATEVTTFSHSTIASPVVIAAFPNVGSHPTAWEVPQGDAGLQSEQTDVTGTTTEPTVSTQTAPGVELTPATSTPETGAGTASTTPTPTPATAAPTLNASSGTAASDAGATAVGSTSALFSPSGTSQTSGTATTVGASEAVLDPTALTGFVASASDVQASSTPATPAGTSQTTAGATITNTPTVSTAGDVVAATVADADSTVASSTALSPTALEGFVATALGVAATTTPLVAELELDTLLAIPITSTATPQTPGVETTAASQASTTETAGGSLQPDVASTSSATGTPFAATLAPLIVDTRTAWTATALGVETPTATSTPSVVAGASPTSAPVVETAVGVTPTLTSVGSALATGVDGESAPVVSEGLARVSVAAQTHSAVAMTREPFRFTPRLSGPTDGPNTTTGVSRRNQLSLGESANSLDVTTGSNESTLDVRDTEIDVQVNRDADADSTE